MTNETFNQKMKELCELKRFAIKHGAAQSSPEKLRKIISTTTLAAGDVAEIWMSYMLGYFSSISDDNLRIFVTTGLDRDGIDFCLKRFRSEYYVQMKFCKHNTRSYPEYVKVVEVGGWKGFAGKNELPAYLGNYALFYILAESGAYDEEELYAIFEANPNLVKICDEVWTYIKG